MKKFFLSPNIERHDFKDGFPRYKKNDSILDLSKMDTLMLHYSNFLKNPESYTKFVYFVVNENKINLIKNPIFKKIISKIYYLILKNNKYVSDFFFSNFIFSFNKLRENNMFITEKEVVNIINTKTKESSTPNISNTNPKIENICIASRNRPETLYKSLKELKKHLKKYNRVPNVIILDDSDEPRINKQYQEHLAKIKKEFEGKIYLINKLERLKLVEKIHQKTSIDKILLRDSLVGLNETTNRLGAARNCLLLKSLNKYSLQIDDDVLYEPKNTSLEENTLTINNPQQWKFFNDFKESGDYFSSNNEINLLENYEKVLGRTLKDVLKDKEIFVKQTGPFLKNNQNTPIQLVCAGGYGDSYFRTPYFPYILKDNQSIKELAKTKKFFHNNKNGAFVSWYQEKLNIVYGANSVGMNMALDRAKNLPPFLPDGIEDGSFGLVLYAKNENHILCKLPIILKHHRPKLINKDSMNSLKTLTSSNFLFTSFMIGIILKIREEKRKDITIKEIGELVISKSQWLENFIEFEKKYFNTILQERSLDITNRIIEFPNAPSFFKRELIKHKKHVNKLLKQNTENKHDLRYFLFDIEGKSYNERMDKLRKRILNYGQLLSYWDEIKKSYEELERENSFVFGKEL